ncbi:MAG: class I SAM-dependent methyltransferase [Candidatus Omnitrophica bacterium]|nr:class I SAM-dependent methyltransferase [Candidatus Omnitrophota bacterium]
MAEQKQKTYWKSFLGIPIYKIDWHWKRFLYKTFGFTFDKLKSQEVYWNTRGVSYYSEFFDSEYYKYEIFFQDLLIKELKNLNFSSFFEAGCGFGWNVKRVKKEFSAVRIGGLDFSAPQLENSKKYLPEIEMPFKVGDACAMPFEDDAFDVGFTMGVFMNIHASKIDKAIDEMCRVAKKYVVHIEWDQNNTTPVLREKRIFKTNIVSHDYKKLYEARGKKVLKFLTYKDFTQDFAKRFPTTKVGTWEQFEGPEKYTVTIVEI